MINTLRFTEISSYGTPLGVARDSKLAQGRGVKAIHGQAVDGRLEPGKVYELVVRSTGETILPPPTDLRP